MGLATTMQTAIAGLKTSERGVQLIAENITNAEVEGYARKNLGLESVYNSEMGQGVRIKEIRRTVDQFLVVEQRRQMSHLGKAEILEDFHLKVQFLFGKPGEDSSLNSYINEFAVAMQRVGSTPESPVFRREVVDKGKQLADKISTVSGEIGRLRQEADQRLAEAIEFINSRVDLIADLNRRIGEQPDKSIDSSAEDERDRAILELSEYINVQVFHENNKQVSVRAAGKPLVLGTSAYHFTYTPVSGTLTPDITLAGGSIQEIKLSNFGYNVTADIASGKMKAWIQIRDDEVPNKLQQELDELTLVLRDEVNKIHNTGASYPPPSTLTGQRPLNSGVATAFSGTGVIRLAVVNPSNGQYVNELQIDLSAMTTVNDVINRVNNNANWSTGVSSATASLNASNQFVLTTAGGNGLALGVVSGAGTETVTGLGVSHYFGFNDFFTTGSRYIQDGNALGRVGLSNLLSVSSRLTSDYNNLATGTLDTTNPLSPPLASQVALTQGNGTTIQRIADKLYDKTQAFTAAGYIAAQSESLVNYGGQIIAYSTLQAVNAEQNHLYQQDAYTMAKQGVEELQGVDRDEELSKLMVLQSAYAANARIVNAVDDMLKTLIAMAR
jgi:flagellar hook-associated protein 1 FlgK